MSVQEMYLPDIGEVGEVTVIEWLVAPGDCVQPEQALLTVESDKATIEVPAPVGGTVRELKVAVGARIAQGAPLLSLDTDATLPPPAANPAPAATPRAAAASVPTPPQSVASATDDAIPVYLPDIGDVKDVPVIEILVQPGDRIVADQSILTLESDKATMDIPALRAGTVRTVAVAVGQRLNAGDLLLTLATEDAPAHAPSAASVAAAVAETRAPGEAERRKAPVLPRPEDMAAIATGRKAHASPAVRRFARELGVPLERVKGAGRKGRILKEDVQTYVKQALTATTTDTPHTATVASPPPVDFARFGPVTTQPLSRLKRLGGAHLQRCWQTVPQVTQFDEADITELDAFRRDQQAEAEAAGVRLTFMPFVLKAVAVALTRLPQFKTSLAADGEHLIYKDYCHLGVAVDTPDGLIVPVLRDVDQKGVFQLARELAELSERARAGKLLPADLQGGVFSISSLGGIGGAAFTPIVNAPEVAILGVSRAVTKPFWNGTAFVPRLFLPLSLSYDHRVIDGAEGARFVSMLARLLGDVRRLLL